jgi:hypothetical protein
LSLSFTAAAVCRAAVKAVRIVSTAYANVSKKS